MKRKKIVCLLLGLCLLIGSLGVSAARYMEKTEGEAPVQESEPLDIQAMLVEEILPDAILLVTEILSVIVMLWPTVSDLAEKVTAACRHFGSATEGVLKVSANGKATQSEVKGAIEAAAAAREEAQRAALATQKVMQIVALMACGNDSLVENGTARRIMEVMEDEGKK